MGYNEYEEHINKDSHKKKIDSMRLSGKSSMPVNRFNRNLTSNSAGRISSNLAEEKDKQTKLQLYHSEDGFPINLKELTKYMRLYPRIQFEWNHLLQKTENRKLDENQIFETLKKCFHAFNDKIDIFEIGSSAYGIASTNTNYNIWVDTSRHDVTIMH